MSTALFMLQFYYICHKKAAKIRVLTRIPFAHRAGGNNEDNAKQKTVNFHGIAVCVHIRVFNYAFNDLRDGT